MNVARSNQYLFRFCSYHLYTSRCVRGAYLCGIDPHTGSSCDHRSSWLVDHLQSLSEVYCITTEALRIRASAYQVILRVDNVDAAMLSNHEVIKRWQQMYRMPASVRRYLNGAPAHEYDAIEINELCQSWREQMTQVGKFVGHINQTLSRRANLEDGCSGRFWEPRTRLRDLSNASALRAARAVVGSSGWKAQSRRPADALPPALASNTHY